MHPDLVHPNMDRTENSNFYGPNPRQTRTYSAQTGPDQFIINLKFTNFRLQQTHDYTLLGGRWATGRWRRARDFAGKILGVFHV